MIKQLTGSELDLQALLIKIAKTLNTSEYSYLSHSAKFFSKNRDLEALFTTYLKNSLEVKSYSKKDTPSKLVAENTYNNLKNLATYISEERLHLYDFKRKDPLTVAQLYLSNSIQSQDILQQEELEELQLLSNESNKEAFFALLQANLLQRLSFYLDFDHILPKFNNFIESSSAKIFFVSNSKLLQEAQASYLKAFLNCRNALIEERTSSTSITSKKLNDYQELSDLLPFFLAYAKGNNKDPLQQQVINFPSLKQKIKFTNLSSIIKEFQEIFTTTGLKSKVINVENFSREKLLGTFYSQKGSTVTLYPESLCQSNTLLFIKSKDILANKNLALDIFKILQKGSYNYSELAHNKYQNQYPNLQETFYVDAKIVILGNSFEQEEIEELLTQVAITSSDIDGVSGHFTQDTSFISQLSSLERELAIETLSSQVNFLADRLEVFKNTNYSFIPPLIAQQQNQQLQKELLNNYFDHSKISILANNLSPEKQDTLKKIKEEFSTKGRKAIYGEATNRGVNANLSTTTSDDSYITKESAQEVLEALYTNYAPFFSISKESLSTEETIIASVNRGKLCKESEKTTSSQLTEKKKIEKTESQKVNNDNHHRKEKEEDNSLIKDKSKLQELEKLFAPLPIFTTEESQEKQDHAANKKERSLNLNQLYSKTFAKLKKEQKSSQTAYSLAQEESSQEQEILEKPITANNKNSNTEEKNCSPQQYSPSLDFLNNLGDKREERRLSFISLLLNFQALNYLILNKSTTYSSILKSPSLDFIINSIWLLLRDNEHNKELTIKPAQLSHYLDYCSELSLWNPDFTDFQNSTLENPDLSELYNRENCRNNHYYQAEQKGILDEVITINTKGSAIGQVNGLACIEQEEYSKEAFGSIFRISSFLVPEEGSVQDIDEAIGMAGSTAIRANLMTTNYIQSLFADKPSFSGVIVTEQLYNNVDGDSGSITSFCALASALSHIPIKQSIAMTGSMDLQGNVLAVGGLNYKIDAYFQLCLKRGLTGAEGVIIPQSNLNHLELDPLISKAITEGIFHIYTINHVSEAFEIVSDTLFVKESDEEASKACKSLTKTSWPAIKQEDSFIHTVGKEEEKSKNNLLHNLKNKLKRLVGLDSNEE